MGNQPHNASHVNSNITSPDSGRICGACKSWKPWVAFDKKSNGKNGFDSRCKSCISKAKLKKRIIKKKSKLPIKQRPPSCAVISIAEQKISKIYLPYSRDSFENVVEDFINAVIVLESSND